MHEESLFWTINPLTRLLIDQMNCGIIGLDSHGTVCVWNDWMVKTTGLETQMALGSPLNSLLPETSPVILESILEVSRTGNPKIFSPVFHESYFPLKDIRQQLVRMISANPKESGDHDLFIFIEDMTQIFEYEQSLKDRFIPLVESSPDHIFMLSPEGIFLTSNDRVSHLGYKSGASIIGKHISEIHSSEVVNIFQEKITHVLSTGELVKFEHSLWKKPDIRYHEDTYYPIRRGKEILAIGGICRDITERKRLEDQLRQIQKREAIGSLAGGIAHDFNNILSAVIGYTELAYGEAPEWSLSRNYLNQVKTAGERAKKLVQQILSFSRQSEHERIPMQIEPILKEALKLIRSTIPTSVKIEQDIKSCHPILGDPTQLHQVVLNLCTNAEYAMREKGGILKIELSEIAIDGEAISQYPGLTPGPHLKLMVSDTGIGMDEPTLVRIFEPYFTTKPKEEGTGLGLAVVQGIVRNHQGFITVYSKPGEGTTFHLYFPVVEKTATEPVEKENKTVPGGNERILLVDDEAPLAQLGRKMLHSLGYRVMIQTESMAALNIFRSQPESFDLVITDMNMPEMTGDILAAEIMKISPYMPIILCTGFSHKMDEKKAKHAGIAGYLNKPITIESLAIEVRRVLDQKRT
ncbi:MAG: ATP-binding protein [Thermodesulfobacteriota bacterium]